MVWTESQVDLLITLWARGKTPSQIAARLSTLGHDNVLEKIHSLRLGRPARRTVSVQAPRTVRQVSSGQHSPRFRSVLSETARRRAEQRKWEDAVPPRAVPDVTGDRQVGLLAALLAMDESHVVDSRQGPSALFEQRLRGWVESAAPVTSA